MPSITRPHAVYCRSRKLEGWKQMKNWQFAVSGALVRAMLTVPRRCGRSLNSALRLWSFDPPVPVLDHPPADQKMPFVVLDRIIGRPQDILNRDLTSFLAYFSVWSAARGHRQVQNIVGAARTSLHRANLTPAEGGIVEIRVTRTDVLRDGDGVTYMGALEIDILAEHEERT